MRDADVENVTEADRDAVALMLRLREPVAESVADTDGGGTHALKMTAPLAPAVVEPPAKVTAVYVAQLEFTNELPPPPPLG